jgi:Flp pilus assembly protein TadD
VLLQAYSELSARDSSFDQRYLDLLNEMGKSRPAHPFILAALGHKAMMETTPEANGRAIEFLRKAIAAGATDPATFQDLAESLVRVDHLQDAVAVLRRGIELAPYNEILYKLLAWRLIKLKQYTDARQTIRQCVQLFPEDEFMRDILHQVESMKE